MTTLPPLAPSRIRLVWCLRNPFWRPYEDNDATWDAGDWYHMSRLHADLTSERPYPKRGAWVARRSSADDAWDVTRSSRRPSMVAMPDAVMHAALALMAQMDKAHEIEWIGRNGQGWPLKRGAYGMHVPQVLVVLVDDAGALRWLVVGGPVPLGRFAMLFDSVKLGADGQPHPRGLYAVPHAAADALWAASNAVSV